MERYSYDTCENTTAAEWAASEVGLTADRQGDRHYTGTLLRMAGRTRFSTTCRAASCGVSAERSPAPP
ncbi:hypothetical protein SCATT_49790 [Streptantibioticus cattleyicolor NRRL 8057 = DSM 46488]|uniref:Uncharacterized protein n=2 Tax=Kitasatosporales TaxID=85011 RepID=G8X0W1_STREN|nr:hypothetical protein SCATT_49790 [Streptantibioticus cattleyicolor NRRL 8057 = DSM 46488]